MRHKHNRKYGQGFLIVSNGLVKNKKGSATFIVANDKEIILKGSMIIHGYIDSYRSEISGIIGSIIFSKIFQEYKNTQEIQIHCDSKSAILELERE